MKIIKNLTFGALASVGFTLATMPVLAQAPTNMALIPAGSFIMGDTFNDGGDVEGHAALPLHTVNGSAFYMDKYEVTKALWDTVRTWAVTNGYGFDNAGSGKAANHPVQMVSWYDSVKWCAQLARGTWLKLADVLARTNDWTGSVIDSNAGEPTRFYRVVAPRQP